MTVSARSRLISAALSCLAPLMLAGCDGPARAGGQVAARVNGTEIPLHRVRAAQPAQAAPATDRQEAARALERVIDQELLVQAALALDLDRQPSVAAAIDAARRQILAQAFVDKAVGGAAKSTPEELQAFYEQHPALFERRRIYRFREIAVAAPPEELEAIRRDLDDAGSLDEIEARLKARNVAYNVATVTRPAEQLPLGHLPRLARMRDGDTAVLAGVSGFSVLQLLESQDAPLDLEQARPIIARFLEARKRLQIAEETVRRLREKARIEYAAEFANRRAGLPARPQGGAAPLTTSAQADENQYRRRGQR